MLFVDAFCYPHSLRGICLWRSGRRRNRRALHGVGRFPLLAGNLMGSLTKRERSIASKFRKREKAKEQAKKFYDRADALTLEIAKSIQPKPFVRIREDGQQLHLQDNTKGEEMIVGWGHGAVRRYDLKVVNP